MSCALHTTKGSDETLAARVAATPRSSLYRPATSDACHPQQARALRRRFRTPSTRCYAHAASNEAVQP